MKTTNTLLLAVLLSASRLNTFAQDSAASDPIARLMRLRAQEDADTNAPMAVAPPAQPLPVETQNSESPVSNSVPEIPAFTSGGTNGLRLNFNNVPLEMVLKYLSDAAGFHIIMDTQVHGNVTVISSHSMDKDEAVVLLNAVLLKNGYAAIRNEQFLTIVDRADAKNRNIPVIVQPDPEKTPNNDIIVTQIIPLRFVEAEQLVKDLSPFISQSATIIANEAGNSIIITDTQANIRHLCEIIKAIDSSAEASTEIHVFRLQYANPTDVATLLSGVFPSQTSGGASQTPVRFGGGGGGRGNAGGFGGGRGGAGGFGGGNPFAALFGGATGANSGANDRIRKQTQVIAVAEMRTSSVVVTAQKDLMDEIKEMIREIDVPSTRDQKVFVYHLDHGDPAQAAAVLQGMFQSSTSSRSGTSSSQNSALQTRETQNASSIGSSTSSGSSLSNSGRSGGGGGRSSGGGF